MEDASLGPAGGNGEADVIITLNLRDFPREALSPYGIEACVPDQFVSSTIHYCFNPIPLCL